MNKVDRFKEITSHMADVYEKKNRNYGDSFSKLVDELGLIAGLVPLHNKLSRAISLVKGDKNEFESLEDTLLDLANYSLMMLMEVEAEHNKSVATVNTVNMTKILDRLGFVTPNEQTEMCTESAQSTKFIDKTM